MMKLESEPDVMASWRSYIGFLFRCYSDPEFTFGHAIGHHKRITSQHIDVPMN